MVVMRVDPSCLVSVRTHLPSSSAMYSPLPMLRLKAERVSRKLQRRFMYLWVHKVSVGIIFIISICESVPHLIKSLCVILVFRTCSGMYCSSSCWHSSSGRSGSEPNLTHWWAWSPTAYVWVNISVWNFKTLASQHTYTYTTHLPGKVCQFHLFLQFVRPSGTCTPAAPPHPQCRVYLGQCSEVTPGGPVLEPPVGSVPEPLLVLCCGHEMEPVHVSMQNQKN